MGDVNKTIKLRIEEISELIFQVANGNFDYKIDQSDNDDELDAIIAGVNMLGQELKASTVSRDHMQNILDGVIDILMILNDDFTVKSANEVCCESLQVSEKEIINKSLWDLIESSEEKQNDIIHELTTEGKAQNVEILFKTKDQGTLPTTSAFSLLKDEKSRSTGYMLISKDITHLKDAEKKLIKAKEEAEEANKSKGRFLANMSHEIRTPLNGIIGFTELLLNTKTDEIQRDYLEMIKVSGETLGKLLNDVLDLNKIDLDKLVIEIIAFDFRASVSSNLNPYKYLANKKGLKFDFQFDPNLPEAIKSDPTRINQILLNLIGNAIKFTEKGSITVGFFVKEKSGDSLIIRGEVTDTGIGIPKAKQDLVFETFTQSDSSTTRKYGGSGLGLTICRELINLLGGKIGITSPPENKPQGTTFWIEFPATVTKSSASITKPANVEILNMKGKTLLVVDDNKVNLLLLEKILIETEAKLITAENGKEALDIIERENIDMVFMDIQMPVMDGFIATSILRSNKFFKPILALSANVDKDTIKKCLNAGMDDYLQKPYYRDQIFSLLQKWNS